MIYRMTVIAAAIECNGCPEEPNATARVSLHWRFAERYVLIEYCPQHSERSHYFNAALVRLQIIDSMVKGMGAEYRLHPCGAAISTVPTTAFSLSFLYKTSLHVRLSSVSLCVSSKYAIITRGVTAHVTALSPIPS